MIRLLNRNDTDTAARPSPTISAYPIGRLSGGGLDEPTYTSVVYRELERSSKVVVRTGLSIGVMDLILLSC